MLEVLTRRQTPKFENTTVSIQKKLPWLIDNPPENAMKIVITPEIAAEMLAYNTHNRPVRHGHVAKLAAIMAAGKWPSIKSPVVFSKSGTINDGQHRLMACVQSGAAFESWVHFGDEDENFQYHDIGQKRTAGDIFSINGVKNPNVVSAATKFIRTYRNKSNPGPQLQQTRNIDPGPLYDYYDNEINHLLMDQAQKLGALWANYKMPYPSLAAGLFYVCAERNQTQAADFFKKCATGVGFTSARDPIRKLRDYIGREKITNLQMATFVIDTWNAVRLRKSIGAFSVDANKALSSAV